MLTKYDNSIEVLNLNIIRFENSQKWIEKLYLLMNTLENANNS